MYSNMTLAGPLSLVLPEARYQPAAGATATTRLVGLRRSLVRILQEAPAGSDPAEGHIAAKSMGFVRSSERVTGGSGYLRPVAQLKRTARSWGRTRPSTRPCL